MKFTSLLHIGAWACIPVLMVASWTPGDIVVRTGLDGVLEHVLAFAITGALFAAAYPQRQPGLIVALLALYAAALETGQLFVPGRSAGLIAFLAGALGAAAGAALMRVLYPIVFRRSA